MHKTKKASSYYSYKPIFILESSQPALFYERIMSWFLLLLLLCCFVCACNDQNINIAKSHPNGLKRVNQLVTHEAFDWDEVIINPCTMARDPRVQLTFTTKQQIYAIRFFARPGDQLSTTLEGSPAIDTILLVYQNSNDINGSLTLLTSDDDGAEGGLSSITNYSFIEASTYTLLLSSWHGKSIGSVFMTLQINDQNLCNLLLQNRVKAQECLERNGLWSSTQQSCLMNPRITKDMMPNSLDIGLDSNRIDMVIRPNPRDMDLEMNDMRGIRPDMRPQEDILEQKRMRCDRYCREESMSFYQRCIMMMDTTRCREETDRQYERCFNDCWADINSDNSP
jgi:hypothetical protein